MSTFKRYLGIQFMMFIFGIVGPSFLVMFFVSDPDPNMRWAFWAGLFITYADIMIALAITKGTLGEDKAPADMRVALAVAKRVQGKRGLGSNFDTSPAD
ncbi:hypothetical protein [Mycobacterium asiaticum]|uniref:Uncharacterized protein n=1 Tax=Mycobacterium asiaticum TaxID=1790 RepID=A0A1A3MX72_MYCAS|nr:hypothetical protein [Mycobacterium asiaticum]OBK14503.1 hypothetical protein A5636_07620 [Mycobacterium asiaticum]